MTKENIHNLWIASYAVLLFIGALLVAADHPSGFYPFAVGTLLAVAQSFTYALQNKSEDIRISRLHRLNFLCSLVLVIAAGLIWMNNNGWVVMIILYCVLTVFLSFRGKQ